MFGHFHNIIFGTGVVQTLLGAGAGVNIATSDVSDVMFYWYMNVLKKLLYM